MTTTTTSTTAWIRRFGYHFLFFYGLVVLFAYLASTHIDATSDIPTSSVVGRPGAVYLPLIIGIVLGIVTTCVPMMLEAGDAMDEGPVWGIFLIGIAGFVTVNLLAWSTSNLVLCFIPVYVAS